MPFPTNIQLIIDGEPVAAGVPNRPLQTLDQRTQYLFQVLQMAAVGSTLFARQVAVNPSLVPGQPVYWSAANARFEAALSAAVSNVEGLPVTAESAHTWGIVWQKDSATQADLLLCGFAPLNITAALEPGQTLAAGLYYLSRSTPGALTRTVPPVAMPVLRSDGLGNVYVNPAWEDPLTNHVHSQFLLRAAPAGDHTYPLSGPHVITSPDPSVEGWLPANHAVFDGLAPERAVFGYNLKANKGLASLWPPVPVGNAVLLKDGVQVQDGPVGLVIFDRNGIWWTSDKVGQVPFPDHVHTTPGIISEWSQPSDYLHDTHEYEMQLKLYFTRPTFLSDQTVVTSLVSTDDRLKINCAVGENQPASVGPLSLSLDLVFLAGASDTAGYNVFKSFNDSNQTFSSGPVISGVYALSSNLTLTGDAVDTVTIASVPQQVYRGDVGIDVNTSQDRELFADLVRLDGASEEYLDNIMYIGFDPGRQQAMRVRIPVPETLNLVSPQMVLKFRLLGLGAGTLPALTLSYLRVPAPTAIDTATSLTPGDTALTLATGIVVTANQYVDVQSSAFTVAPGDDVFFTLQRGASDSYIYAVGVVRQVGLVTSA